MVRGRSNLGQAKYAIEPTILAEGGYGTISRCTNTTTNQIYAVKVYRARAGECGHVRNVVRELKLLRTISHENVVHCVDFFQSEGRLHVVMPLLDCDLGKLICEKEFDFPEDVIKSVFQQILRGLNAIHRKWFLHRDLTPQNVLVDTRSPRADSIKITDFGSSRTFGKGNMTSQVGQLWYRAPELIMMAKHYGPSVDIWSAGCILAEMYSKEALFACKTASTMSQLSTICSIRGKITEEQWPLGKKLPLFIDEFQGTQTINLKDRFPRKAAELVDRMIAYDPLKRPNTEACLADSYFTEEPLPASPAEYPWLTDASS